MPGATRSVLIKAPQERVFDVITDYMQYPAFLPEVKSVRLSGRTEREVLVHYEVNIVRTLRYTLRMEEERPSRIRWSFVEGEVMKDNRGEWRVVTHCPS